MKSVDKGKKRANKKFQKRSHVCFAPAGASKATLTRPRPQGLIKQ